MKRHIHFHYMFLYSFAIFLFLIGVLCAFSSSDDRSTTSLDLDALLRKIAVQFIEQTLEKAESIDDAAEKVGLETNEFKQICRSLDIDIDFFIQKFEHVEISSAKKLSDNQFEADVILEYQAISPYVLLVEKSAHKLFLVKYENNSRKLIDIFECKTGKKQGIKLEEGDHKTPEGTYFFINRYSRSDIRRLVGVKKAHLYGEMAFAMDFPNSIDHLEGKNGGGIWLHGTDESFEETSNNETRGCVVLTNRDIKTLSRFIGMNSTPIIIVDKLNFTTKKELESRRKELLSTVENWKSAWEKERIDDYIQYYAKSFTSQGKNHSQWKKYKSDVFSLYKIFHIKLDNFAVFKHNNGFVVQFFQNYSASNMSAAGVKTLYLMQIDNSWKIIGEHFIKKMK